MSNLYNSIPILKTKRSKFNLSYTHKTTLDMGMLIPIGNWICYPNEKYTLGNQAVIRLQPLAAPLMHRIKVKVASFFVPWRLCWDEYEDWANSGIDGSDLATKSLPLWDDYYENETAPPKYSLWDYLGRNALTEQSALGDPDKNFVPNDMLRRAYNLIYNEYFLNRNVQNEVSLTNNDILYVNFKNDYFASALPFQQRGIDPAIALSFTDSPIVWDFNANTTSNNYSSYILPYGENNSIMLSKMAIKPQNDLPGGGTADIITPEELVMLGKRQGTIGENQIVAMDKNSLTGKRVGAALYRDYNASLTTADIAYLKAKGFEQIDKTFNVAGMKADNSTMASTFDANQLRLLMQTKKFLERNARCGSRYTEQLLGRWGVFAGDARLNRPEFIYSTSNTIAIEELPQLSETGTTPQGKLTGKGTGAQSNIGQGHYTTKEHGCIIQMLWLVPDLDYIPQGFDRETLIHTRLEEYAPEFAHLSEQMIKKGELYFENDPAKDNAQFGYQPIWSELRHRRNVVSAEMRDTFDYWHLARKFANQPSLNEDFIKVSGNSSEFKRIFFSGTTAQGFIVAFGNQCTCLRPLPKYGTPGFVDHF